MAQNRSIFVTPVFAQALQAYDALCNRQVLVAWQDGLHKTTGAWGQIYFDTTPIEIVLDPNLPVKGAFDVLMHELAHALAGYKARHGKRFKRARKALDRRFAEIHLGFVWAETWHTTKVNQDWMTMVEIAQEGAKVDDNRKV